MDPLKAKKPQNIVFTFTVSPIDGATSNVSVKWDLDVGTVWGEHREFKMPQWDFDNLYEVCDKATTVIPQFEVVLKDNRPKETA